MNSVFLKRRFVLTCLFGWLCAAPVFALDPTKAITQYVHDVWTNKDGLPQNSIYCMVQTRDGYLWIGTYEGLVRFDGLRFTVFDRSNTKALPHKRITALAEDREGALWIGTYNGGLVRLKNGEFTQVSAQLGLALGEVGDIFSDRDGSLWIGSATGLHRFQAGKLTTWTKKNGLSHDFVLSIFRDKSDRLWVGTLTGLDQFKEGQFIHFSTKDGLTPGRVFAFCEDRKGSLWIGTIDANDTSQGGLNEFKDGTFKTYSLPNGEAFGPAGAILEDRDGNLWIGTNYRGLYRFQNGTFTSYSTKDSLSDNGVTVLCEDREGSLWVGTFIGLNRLRDSNFTIYDKTTGLSDNLITRIFEDRTGTIWLGTAYGGLNRYKEGVFSSFSTKAGLSQTEILRIQEDRKGDLWVSSGGGLYRFQHGRFVNTFAENDSKYMVRAWLLDAQDRFWVGTDQQGLLMLQENKLIPYLSKGELPSNRVLALHLDRKENLWISTDNGLCQFSNGKLKNFTAEIGYPIHADTFYEENDILWIGTEGHGLFRYKEGKFVTCRAKDGLFDDSVFSILDDGQGNFWMTSNKGIFRAARQDLIDFAAGKIQVIKSVSYGIADGLKNNESSGGAYRTKDGKLWFPTIAGAAVIDPANIRYNKLLPPVVIEQAIADGATFSLDQPQQLVAGTQNLEFHYAGLSLVAAEKNQYKYQLVGYDKTWVDAGNRRTAYYTNLRPGNYTFRVIASNNDGVWNETGASYSFSLKPYFWQTWWFYGMCIGGIGLAGFGLNNLRTRLVMAREREKTQLKIAELRLEKTQMQAQVIEAENNRKTQELEEARRLQLSMLPKGNVQLERIEITGAMRTATEVGGDYYDFLPMPDGRNCVVIGDATGHGMSAGLIVGMVKMGLTSRLQAHPKLQPMIEDLNTALKQSLTHRGVGMCLGATMIDPTTLQVELCSNGMPFPYHFTNGALRAIELKAPPLGFLKRVNVPTARLQLQTGDALIWVSDGFEERMNARNEEWGAEQVVAALTAICQRESAGEAIARELIAACDRAADGRSNDDDMTIVVIKVLSESA